MNKETGGYDEAEFLKHPDRYTSTFKTKVSHLTKTFFSFLIQLNFIPNRTSKGKRKNEIRKIFAALCTCDLFTSIFH